jgi:ABC-2 type transport system permease protein
MQHKIKLFIKLISISMRSQMQYRASFYMLAFSYFFSTFVGILGIWVLFDRFKLVAGWSFTEVSVIYGIVHMGFSFAETFARGFDKFDQMLIHADFDRVLLRPMGSLFQVASSQVQLLRLGRFFQGLVVLVIGLTFLEIPLFSFELVVIVLAIIGTACLFYGLIVLQATLAFWTTESLELMNIASFGGVEACQYPITIYPKAFQAIFTYIIPVGCVSYFPVAIILGRVGHQGWYQEWSLTFALLFPLVGVLFLALSCLFWRVGVRRYTSTGC